MATLGAPLSFNPFNASPLDFALDAEGVTGPLADIARSIYMQESGGGKNTKTSSAGARGGMQIIPDTFKRVADKGWDINNPIHNARGGVRYLKKLWDDTDGDPRLTAVGYYGGEGAIPDAVKGKARYDADEPKAPNTLQYADQVLARTDLQNNAGGRRRSIVPQVQDPQNLLTDWPPKTAMQPKKQPGGLAEVTLGDAVDFDPFAKTPQMLAAEKKAADEEAAENRGRRVRQLSTPIIGPLLAATDIDPKTIGAAALGGAMDIGMGALNAGEWLAGKLGIDPNDRTNNPIGRLGIKLGIPQMTMDDIRQGQAQWNQEQEEGPDATAYKILKEGAKIGATWGAGKLISAPLELAAGASSLAKVAPTLSKLAKATESGGFNLAEDAAAVAARDALPTLARTAQRAGNLGIRSAGGAAQAGAQAAAMGEDPTDAMLFGAGMAPGFKLIGKGAGAVGSKVAEVVREARAPQIAKDAAKVARAAGFNTPEEVAAAEAALRAAEGPQMLGRKTVPQVFRENTGLAQLGRSLGNAGDQQLLAAEQLQNEARIAALNRINERRAAARGAEAMTHDTVPDARSAFGQTAEDTLRPLEEATRKRASAAYEPVEETAAAMHLPLDQMKAAKNKFLGRGTVGTGKGAKAAMDEAQDIGTETLEALKPTTDMSKTAETLVGAVRKMGIRNRNWDGTAHELKGEIDNLKTWAKGIVNNKNGRTIDDVAEAMYERGFIPDADPNTLMNALRDDKLRHGFAVHTMDDVGDVFRRRMEASMGDIPTEPEVINKAVPFREVRNLRTSMQEMSQAAKAQGHHRESAALDAMVQKIDNRIEELSIFGPEHQDEVWNADVEKLWRQAQAGWKDYRQRFHSGAVGKMFTPGSGGRFVREGDQLAPHFFSNQANSPQNIRDLKRVANPETMDALANYALTGLMAKRTAQGNLAPKAMRDWANAHSRALDELLTKSEHANVKHIIKDAEQARQVQELGKAVGSNTKQNQVAADLLGPGWLESPGARYLAGKLPLGNLALDKLGSAVTKNNAQRIGELMANPDKMADALAAWRAASAHKPFGASFKTPAAQKAAEGLYRISPALAAQ